MKRISLLVFLVTGTIVTFAQTTSTSVEFKKALRPALVMPLAFNPNTAEETILAKLKETGYKPEKSGGFLNKKNKEEGFYKFSGVQLPELSNQKLDLYFKIDPVENNDNNRSAITLLVSKGYENFVSADSDSATFSASENFLNGFVQNTNVYNINQKLDEQKQSIASSEKKWTELRDRQADAKRKIAELESEIKVLQQEELLQQQEVEKLRTGLKDLEARRTSAQK
jgi:spore coat protein CotF